MKRIYNIIIVTIIFVVLILIFTFLYNNYAGYNMQDALYISTSFQTFTGNSIVDQNKKAKNVSIIQMTISYILMIVILHFLMNL